MRPRVNPRSIRWSRRRLRVAGRACVGALVGWGVVTVLLLAGCGERGETHTPDGRVIIDYWEKWTDFEGDAMQAVVDDFNASQDRIFVRKLTVSQIAQKLMLATAGGNPPDVAGLFDYNVATYAERGALLPLDTRFEAAGMSADDYIPSVWDVCVHRGHVWALPTTPATVALHWNRQAFRDAGLDPDQPPRSIAELDDMAEKLTVVELERGGETVQVRYPELTDAEKQSKDFRIVKLGFSPNEPGWWKNQWGYWFGAEMWNGQDEVTADSPENIAAMRWHGGYTEKYGIENMQRFGASFSGSFASPQNPFMDGRVAMVLQGVWMYNFIDRFAPTLDWAAAPFPSVDPDNLPGVSISSCDVIVIPKGSKHPDAAWEFIRYVNSRQGMERLCLGQRKFSSLREYSDGFLERHPNPYIEVFIDLANSPNNHTFPQTSIWTEYNIELNVAADRVFGGIATPEEALKYTDDRMQWKLDRELRRWEMTKDARLAEWEQQ